MIQTGGNRFDGCEQVTDGIRIEGIIILQVDQTFPFRSSVNGHPPPHSATNAQPVQRSACICAHSQMHKSLFQIDFQGSASIFPTGW